MFFASGELAQLLSTFVNWGFMMALLFNLVSYSEVSYRARSPLWLCLTINLSYFITSVIDVTYVYPFWASADLLTLVALFVVQRKREKIPALYYCAVGLVLNAILHIAMYLDLGVAGNYEPWWLWTLYSLGINLNDALMIIVLVVNRDFLGLCRAGRLLKTVFQRQAHG
ncbi:hypothetical protein [Pseudoalteromonas sp. T1lg10]|uniref:hypothetical protein n=1 Tax=Pseudoalteromonas sp. T1lg10 TaxID=2077093 RepID=UPI000CF61507|nr:hypothetical protein [Pseudoalteromonas sp. T1lg10]